MTLAMPDTERGAQQAIENLEARRPKVWEDIDGVPREIINDRGEKTLNVEWLRLHVKIQREDRKAEHTAAVMDTDALNKGTESLKSTVKRVFQSQCMATEKSEFCASQAGEVIRSSRDRGVICR